MRLNEAALIDDRNDRRGGGACRQNVLASL
jgi:hypothetical protein